MEIFTLISVLIPTLFYPPSHKILRNKIVYIVCIGLSLLVLGIALSYSAENPNNKTRTDALLAFSPLTFIILYKLFDSYIRKKLNRPIYFSKRYIKDLETTEQTNLELTLQTILGLIPIMWLGLAILLYGTK